MEKQENQKNIKHHSKIEMHKIVKFFYGTDNIGVKLISFTEKPLEVIAKMTVAATSNTDGLNFDDIKGKLSLTIARKVLEGKDLPIGLEAIKYTFAIENISRNCTHQIVRSRVGAGFSQQSQRGLILKKPLIYRVPKTVEKCDKYSNRNFIHKCLDATNTYFKLLEYGVLAEDARFILPSAICTHIVSTYNLMSLRGFLRNRRCYGSQWEIRDVANKMLKEVKRVHPFIAEYLDLSCKKIRRCTHPQKDFSPFVAMCPIKQSFGDKKILNGILEEHKEAWERLANIKKDKE